MVYASIGLAILSTVSHVVMGCAFVAIVTVAICRNDLVIEAIDRGLRRHRCPETVKATAAEGWTTVAEQLAFKAVPAAVRIQMLINRLHKFTVDGLDPLDERLKTVSERLTKMLSKCRRARMAYDFEKSEVNTLLASIDNRRTTVSTGTITSEIIKPPKSRVVKLEPPTAEAMVSDNVPALSVAKTTTSGTSISAVPPAQPETLIDTVRELALYLMSIVMWLKNALTSKVYRRNAIKVYQTIHSALNSELVKLCFKFAFDGFDRFVKLYTHVNTVDGVTTVLMRIPPTENDQL